MANYDNKHGHGQHMHHEHHNHKTHVEREQDNAHNHSSHGDHDKSGHEGHENHSHHNHGEMVNDFKKRFYISLIITYSVYCFLYANEWRGASRRPQMGYS